MGEPSVLGAFIARVNARDPRPGVREFVADVIRRRCPTPAPPVIRPDDPDYERRKDPRFFKRDPSIGAADAWHLTLKPRERVVAIRPSLCGGELIVDATGQAFAAWFNGYPGDRMAPAVCHAITSWRQLRAALRHSRQPGGMAPAFGLVPGAAFWRPSGPSATHVSERVPDGQGGSRRVLQGTGAAFFRQFRRDLKVATADWAPDAATIAAFRHPAGLPLQWDHHHPTAEDREAFPVWCKWYDEAAAAFSKEIPL
jgi:hypothetical protein